MGRRTKRAEGRDDQALLALDTSLMEDANLQDRVYQILRNALIRGHFAPGAQLTIRSLAKVLGTSMIPVRDALQRLVAERALELTENRSARVPEMRPDSFRELVEIRLMLEGAAVRRLKLPLTPEQMDELRLVNHKVELAVRRGDAEAVTVANMEFHFLLYRLAGGELLYRMIETLWVRAGPLLRLPFRAETYEPDVFSRGVERHNEILEALVRGDHDTASRALISDIGDTARWYERCFSALASPAAPAEQAQP